MKDKKFGRLKVIELAYEKKYPTHKKKFWRCRCECGTIRVVICSNLYSGHTKSCGCLARELLSKRQSTHREAKTRFYRTWGGMHYRCRHNQKSYETISVCVRWKRFEKFREDMYDSYCKHVSIFGEKNTTIDRIDSTKNYSPENCRWATYRKQANNTSANKPVTLDGKTQNLNQWIWELGLNKSTVYYRLKKGLTYEEALYKGRYSRWGGKINDTLATLTKV